MQLFHRLQPTQMATHTLFILCGHNGMETPNSLNWLLCILTSKWIFSQGVHQRLGVNQCSELRMILQFCGLVFLPFFMEVVKK